MTDAEAQKVRNIPLQAIMPHKASFAQGGSPAGQKHRVMTDAHAQKVSDFIKDLQKLSSEEDDNPDLGSTLRAKSSPTGKVRQYLMTAKTKVLQFIQRIHPMHRIIESVEHQYGSGVAVYYLFLDDIIFLNGWLFVLWLLTVILEWFIALSTNYPYNAMIIVLNFVGANGPRTTDGTWFFYSGYESVMGGYQMGLAYSVTIIATFVVSTLYILYFIREALLHTSMERFQEMYQLPCILYAWDWEVTYPETAACLRRGTVQQLKGELSAARIRKEVRDLEASDDGTFLNAKRKHQIRRGLGIFLSFVLVGASLVGFYFILAYDKVLNSYFSLLSAVLLQFINRVIPMTQKAIVKFEQIPDPSEEIRQEVLRIYFIKMANIVFLVFDMSNTNVQEGGCVEFVVGTLYIQLLVVDFVSNFVTTVIVPLAKWYVYKKLGKPFEKEEFEVSDNIIDSFYRQCITWIGCCYTPMIFFYGFLCNFLVALSKYLMMRVVNCPPSKPVGKTCAGLYRGLLLVTLFITTIPTFHFMQKQMACGPHVKSTPMESIAKVFGEGQLRKLLYWIFHPILLFIALILSLIGGYLLHVITSVKIAGLQKSTTDLEAEVELLRQLLKNSSMSSPRPRNSDAREISLNEVQLSIGPPRQSSFPRPVARPDVPDKKSGNQREMDDFYKYL